MRAPVAVRTSSASSTASCLCTLDKPRYNPSLIPAGRKLCGIPGTRVGQLPVQGQTAQVRVEMSDAELRN